MAGRHWALMAAVLGVSGLSAAGAEDGIHIPSGRKVGFVWYLNDAAGFRWDISSNGQVSDGSNDAYDGGMQLRVGGTYFSNSGQGRLSKDGREVEIGPWAKGSVQIHRRVYIDAKVGYCRWIDLFTNTTGAAQNIKVQYYSNLGQGVTSTYTTSGKAQLTPKDWGIVTGGTGSSSRPAIVHVFANKGSRLKPNFRYTRNNDSVYQDLTLKIPASKTVALCTFHAQRRGPQARQFLDKFKPRRELAKVPPALRRLIVNMGGATLSLGSLDLPRHEKHDLAVLRNGNELLGQILNKRFDVETFYGKLELPAGRVVGLHVPAPDDAHTQVVLIDGQVVAGRLLNGPVRLRLTNGNEMALPAGRLVSATFALSTERPGEIKTTRPTLVLRSGQRLFFQDSDLDGIFQSLYGTVSLRTDDLRGIRFDTPEGGLHRAIFRNGSVLSGLLAADDLKLKLDLGPELRIRRHLASEVLLPGEQDDRTDLAEMTLRNEDNLFGHLAEESLTLKTQYGEVTVKPSDVSELAVPEAATLGQIRIKLHNGTTVTGQFVGETIAFQIVPGPKLAVFLGHLLRISQPKPSSPTSAPATKPTAPKPEPPKPIPVPPKNNQPRVEVLREETPVAPAAREAEVAARARAEQLARIKTLTAQLAQLQDVAKKLQAQTKAAADGNADAKVTAKLQKEAATVAAKIAALKQQIAAFQKRS